MSSTELNDYLVLRSLNEPISRDDLDAAAEDSGEALSNLREEGVGIEWVDSEVLNDDEGRVTGTVCHYRAEDETTIREHGERAGLPVTRIDRRGEPLDGE